MLRRWLLMAAPALLLAAALLGVWSGGLSAASALLVVGLGTVLLTLGVVFPRTQLYAKCLAHVPGQRVALTFDDGPHPESTRRVLALLARHGQLATFFVIGRKAEAHPEVVREIAAAGHAIGVHGHCHDWLYAFKLPGRVAEDIRKAQDAVFLACGVRPTLFRPPLGLLSPFTAEGAHRASVRLVAWSLRAFDGVAFRHSTDVWRMLSRVRAGDVVLLHDAAEAGTFTPPGLEVLPDLLELLSARGLGSVRLPPNEEAHAAQHDAPGGFEVHSV